MKSYDVIIIGAGAAGLMCAMTAGQRGKQVLVLERANKVGKKILMSGGGRCNFTNLYTEPANYLSHNPHFCKSALSRYSQWDFIALVEKHGIAYHEKDQGQLFCDDSSKQILAMLLDECEQAGVEIITRCELDKVEGQHGFRLETSCGRFHSQSLVVASGGLSVPSLGGSDIGYRIARQYGMQVLPRSAGLVPFTLSGVLKEMSARLSGLSLPARLTCGTVSFLDQLLFTHRGLSGPAVLQLSSYWTEGETISIDLLPATDAAGFLLRAKQQQSKSRLRTVLHAELPKKLVTELEQLWWPTLADKPLAEFADKTLLEIATRVNHWQLTPAGTEGYRTAEVTMGGVDTNDLSSKTMESKTQPGLYFIGEVVDVSGQLGGFNFQWAWSSGYVAGESV
ncbi:NAD(P)/FAD-dependent oxidoreductase [Sulfuriflexus sp.]|uniref:NAD(P)/FAD-dependent oxidoreductase n=1 Tax=Sulfuriflexus sp. TaxID=2015443 RepID=UPI0028CC6C10|nr:NAD(P)/FAD-dependent oxidoreductase [Sulfuriflexus sp.]MDT8405215.1 NAD(P)/FAD-dependent oxidoreductase [Sulfuriflexus sp.]